MRNVIVLLALAAVAWDVPAGKDAPAADPQTYPDEAGFQKRAKLVAESVATVDPVRWRQGWFKAGGDPGKYLPLACMAKLMLNPDDAVARQYMNDDRSYKETYHFAVVNWARFLPLCGDALTADTKKKLAEAHGRGNRYFDQSGTENHKIMWLAAANVMPSYVEGDRFSGMGTAEALAKAKKQLRDYVKGLYAHGQGEWDSSTYLMFDLHGMLNIYDFAKDAETRLLARAALDWYVAGYALKYRDGVYTAPNQRGFAGSAASTISDQTGWLWWDSQARISTNEAKGFLYAMHPATSAWRPSKVLCNIARKKLTGLPVEQRNTKPNYWYGANQKPEPMYRETVYLAPQFTIGTLWNGHGSQLTRFMVAINTDTGPVTLTGGNPRCSDHTGAKTGLGFADGNGRYTQFAAHDNIVVCLSNAPEDDKDAGYSFLRLPDGVEPKLADGGWWTMTIGQTVVGVYPLGGTPEVAATLPDKRGNTVRMLKIPGARTGFVLQVVTAAEAKALTKAKVEAPKFDADMDVTCTGPDGKTLRAKFRPAGNGDAHGNQFAEVSIDNAAVDATKWLAYGGPFVLQKERNLTVSDGVESYIVEFAGELPVYRTK